MIYNVKTTYKKILADTTTPVSIYLRLRDSFPNSLLLESSEYHSRENNISYICCQSIAHIVLEDEQLTLKYPNKEPQVKSATGLDLRAEVSTFRQQFVQEEAVKMPVLSSGLFGYFTFDAIEHFEDIKLVTPKDEQRRIPTLQYHVYRYVIAIDHFRNELYIFENLLEDEESDLERMQYLIQNKNFPEYWINIKCSIAIITSTSTTLSFCRIIISVIQRNAINNN